MLDFEKLANMMEIRVASAHLTIKDRRTGETFVMDFYRPGSKFPLDAVSEELLQKANGESFSITERSEAR